MQNRIRLSPYRYIACLDLLLAPGLEVDSRGGARAQMCDESLSQAGSTPNTGFLVHINHAQGVNAHDETGEINSNIGQDLVATTRWSSDWLRSNGSVRASRVKKCRRCNHPNREAEVGSRGAFEGEGAGKPFDPDHDHDQIR